MPQGLDQAFWKQPRGVAQDARAKPGVHGTGQTCFSAVRSPAACRAHTSAYSFSASVLKAARFQGFRCLRQRLMVYMLLALFILQVHRRAGGQLSMA